MTLFDSGLSSALDSCQRILIAGAGGGFDVFTGLPLYFALQAIGKTVHLANLSFTSLCQEAGRWIAPACVEVGADAVGSKYYFPERGLSGWFREQGHEVPVYCFPKVGVQPLQRAYEVLAERLDLDAVVLVDGGTDSLMRGDEVGLGTPGEDMASIAAVDALPVPVKLLVCLGFGIDTFHGVCHAHFLEAVAALSKSGGYLGAFSLHPGSPPVDRYVEATEYVQRLTSDRESIVNASIISALEGEFGDFHRTARTKGSRLFINPLMALYWCFDLAEVARRNLYLDHIRDTEQMFDVFARIEAFRRSLPEIKPWRDIPV